MNAPVTSTGGGIKINLTQILVTLAVVAVMILLLAKIIKFQLVDASGNAQGSIQPSLKIGA